MKNKLLITISFILIILGLLLHTEISIAYAGKGFYLWYAKMLPSLLPFMILSGIMVRMNLTDNVIKLFYPVLYPIFHISPKGCYALFMGFLCGFPMGSRTVSDLYERKQITYDEACFLLSFCNNIGPVYFCSFVIPLLQLRPAFPFLFGMYGIPLLYGIFLRYTRFGNKKKNDFLLLDISDKINESRFMESLNDSIYSSMENIILLGGYMIFFNFLNTFPHLLYRKPIRILAPLLEITGGLDLLKSAYPVYSLMMLSFGGFSCIAQTYSTISNNSLKGYIGEYFKHKCIISCLTGLYYVFVFFFFSASEYM